MIFLTSEHRVALRADAAERPKIVLRAPQRARRIDRLPPPDPGGG